MNKIFLRVKASDKVTISPTLKKFLESLPPIREVELTKTEWEKLGPRMKEMIKKRQIMWVSSV